MFLIEFTFTVILLQQNMLTWARKTTKHQISTKIKLLWIVIYRRYVFHVVTAGMLSTSSIKHSWKKKSQSYYNEIIPFKATIAIWSWMCADKIIPSKAKQCLINTSIWMPCLISPYKPVLSTGAIKLFEGQETLFFLQSFKRISLAYIYNNFIYIHIFFY